MISKIVFIVVMVSNVVCFASSSCVVHDGSDCECSNVNDKSFESSISNCTKIVVENSPNLTSIATLPMGITELSIIATGLRNLSPDAIASAPNLEKLHIEAAPISVLDLGNPSSSPEKFSNFSVQNCSSLTNIEHISKYASLKSITISYTGLTMIDDEMFENLHQVTFLDISYNKNLQYIEEEAFDDLSHLTYLNMSGCALTKLYGSYFRSVNKQKDGLARTLSNPFQCYEMCDFMKWYWNHRSFYYKSFLGTCSIQMSTAGSYVYYSVYSLNRYTAGCPPVLGIVLGCVAGGIIIFCILTCIIFTLCGIDYQKICCCCFGSDSNRQNAAETPISSNNGNPDYYTMQTPASSQTQYSNIPPSYDELAEPPAANEVARVPEKFPATSSG